MKTEKKNIIFLKIDGLKTTFSKLLGSVETTEPTLTSPQRYKGSKFSMSTNLNNSVKSSKPIQRSHELHNIGTK